MIKLPYTTASVIHVTKFSVVTIIIDHYKYHELLVVIANEHYRAFSHDVMAAILVLENNETAAMLVFQTNPVGVRLFSYVNNFSFSRKFA